MGHHQLDALDYKILSMIAANARTPFLEVARACDVSGAAIHQRIQKLSSLGVLKGSEFILDPQKVGWETCAYVGLFLKGPSSEAEAVVEGLKKIPEVVECHYTTGEYDMFIKMYAKNNLALSRIIQEKIHPLGVRTTSIISYEEVFHRQIPIPESDED